MLKSKSKQRGFTLVELLIVVVIVGLGLFALKSCAHI